MGEKVCENRLMANVVGKQLEWGTKDIATPTFSPQLAQFGYDFFKMFLMQ